MDESKLDENKIGRKALDQNPLDDKKLDENWAHVGGISRFRLTPSWYRCYKIFQIGTTVKPLFNVPNH